MKLRLKVTQDDINADPRAVRDIEYLAGEVLYVASVKRLTPRYHYEYGDDVELEMDIIIEN